MKKLLSLLTISTLTASVPAPLLANTLLTRVKRDVEVKEKNVTTGFAIKINEKYNPWKLVENIDFDTKGKDKWYLYVLKLSLDDDSDYILDLVNAGNPPKKYKSGYQSALYRWDGMGEPNLPELNKKTGKIANWNIDVSIFQQGINFFIKDDKNGYWIKPYQLVTNGQVKVKIANTDIETVKVNGTIMPSPDKNWEFDLPTDSTTVENKDYQIEIAFKVDGKSYTGQIIVSSLLSQPSITVQKNTSPFGNVASYVYQAPTNDKVGDITLTSDLYYSDTEVKVSLNKPTGSTVQSGIVYGLNDNWKKTGQQLDITGDVSLNATMLNSYQGRFLVETKDSADNSSFYYIVLNKNNLTPNFWDTNKGQQFYEWANLNGYNERIKKLNATELNKIINESKNWQQIASDSQLASAIANWFKINGKLSSTEPLTKEQVIEQLKTQIPSSIKIPDVNTSNYDVNKVSFELNQSEFKPNDKVNITVKYNNATSEQFTLQIKGTNTHNNKKKTGLGIWTIFGIVVGLLVALALLGWLLKKFVVDPFILKPIREKKQKAWRIREDKALAEIQAEEEAEKEKRGK